jgi:hypothetical protein
VKYINGIIEFMLYLLKLLAKQSFKGSSSQQLKHLGYLRALLELALLFVGYYQAQQDQQADIS